MAFGSLLIAIVQLVRLVLAYIEKQAKETESRSIKYCLHIAQVLCFESRSAIAHRSLTHTLTLCRCCTVLPLVLRKVPQVHQQKCIYPGTPPHTKQVGSVARKRVKATITHHPPIVG